MNRFLICSAILLSALAPVAAADLRATPMLTNCAKYGYDSYTTKRGDTCVSMSQDPRLHFTSFRQIEEINRPISGFKCHNFPVGAIVCYPKR